MLSITGRSSRGTSNTSEIVELSELLLCVSQKLAERQHEEMDSILKDAISGLRRIALGQTPDWPFPSGFPSIASQVIQSQEEERKRLSRELHDDIGQRLSLAASTVALLLSQSGEGKLTQRLSTLRNDLDHLCSDIHSMSHNLHSYQLEHLGLKSALSDLGLRMSRPGARIEVDVEDLREPRSKDVSLCLYRVAQEAMNNAAKHSHASLVALIAMSKDNAVYMAIQDCGVGFDATKQGQGLGFISMRERLKLVHGELSYQSVLGRGTEIWVTVPDIADRIAMKQRNKTEVHPANVA